ncbi:hypothetical protein DM02DRAFT_681135 [Periconia macrospinosa]|uniref:Uncharacterized protein n=1 Tax=Periconia macrospinosa TaxID=97972 RepID=A0A2V1DKT4_9PLEO|nr:hypothetical protein DM02DRAFT_681135 [Periconia macrospinosa]
MTDVLSVLVRYAVLVTSFRKILPSRNYLRDFMKRPPQSIWQACSEIRCAPPLRRIPGHRGTLLPRSSDLICILGTRRVVLDRALVDTYFGSEDNLHTYLTGSTNGDGFDPPLGGVGRMDNPHFDPREYWLVKVDRRMMQVTEEYTALIETFNKRMEAYARRIRRQFEDDSKRTHTQTLSNVIETIQIFVDCISCITDAWDTFCKNL